MDTGREHLEAVSIEKARSLKPLIEASNSLTLCPSPQHVESSPSQKCLARKSRPEYGERQTGGDTWNHQCISRFMRENSQLKLVTAG